MAGKPRLLPIVLSRDDYRRLEALARAEDRDPLQQARWLLRRALGESAPQQRPAEEGGRDAQ